MIPSRIERRRTSQRSRHRGPIFRRNSQTGSWVPVKSLVVAVGIVLAVSVHARVLAPVLAKVGAGALRFGRSLEARGDLETQKTAAAVERRVGVGDRGRGVAP